MTLKASKIPTHLNSTKKCLIGKLFTDIPQVHSAIISGLYSMWNKPKGFICEEVEDRIYRFYFDNDFDASTKLRRQPWNYKGQLLVLKPWEKGRNSLAYKFDHVPFRVQLWGLPLELCTLTVVKNLCSNAGFAFESEVYNDPDRYKSIPTIVVLMDVSKPLQLGAYLDIDGYDMIWVDFKYEKLPMFCYYCGKIGHEKQRCLELFNDSMEGDAHSCKYGPDLMASEIGKTIDEKQYHHQNQHLMEHKAMVDNVSQQLSCLTFSQKDHGIINDNQEFNPILNSQVDVNYPSFSTLFEGPIHQEPYENMSKKRRNEETYEDKKGKRVCIDDY
ncbi:hypothetical protein Lal_00033984 [Lupinus albus]|nr:hypothetical protein Lal_00033984 [Lupinus albus]